MVFSSQIFLFVFLPVTVVLYTLIPNLKIKNLLLIAASIFFYAYGEPYAVFLMIISVLINHFAAIKIAKKKNKSKVYLSLAIIFNVLILFVFKYFSWLFNLVTGSEAVNIALPIGISFFTFQLMSYVTDVYRNPETVQKNPLNTMLYISFFPQLIAGPIIKYHDFEAQIYARKQTAQKTVAGISKFITGLFKKVVLSDTLCTLADVAFDSSSKNTLSSLCVFVCAVAYCLQLFFDFSGYSDMAIGLGKMFGFDFAKNFNYPYISKSIGEFWRRWHISLSTWFKEYVYIPLGGNRKGKKRKCLNKAIVFLLTGIWHGANFTFLLWGIIHGAFIILEETKFGKFIKKHKIIGHIYTLSVVMIAFIVFRADTVTDALTLTARLFTGFSSDITQSTSLIVSKLSPYNISVFVLSVVLCTPVLKNAASYIKSKNKTVYTVIKTVSLAAIFIYTYFSVISTSYSPFIYFQF